MDWVVSSYSLSIKAILNARRAPVGPHTLVAGKGKALLVGMTQTPKQSLLSAVAEEMVTADRLLRDIGLDCTLFQNTHAQKQTVLEHLRTSQVFHFAGHGVERKPNPLKSALILEDWENDPMTVGDVMDLDLHRESPFLAYLSACETGQITTTKFRDESIHLISAYQLAGFRHVIGTLWKVNDTASLTMATATYRNLQSGGITDESVARSLHQAATQLRHMGRNRASNRALADGRDVVPDEDVVLEGEENWIPFVHFGI
jgi:CHAT domain-containing protein